MKNDLHNDDLEAFFRKKMEEQKAAPSSDGWDEPDDLVWDNVEKAIAPVKEERRFFLGKVLYPAAASLLLLVAFYAAFSTNQKVKSLSQEIEIQDQKIKELEGVVNSQSTIELESVADKSVGVDKGMTAEESIVGLGSNGNGNKIDKGSRKAFLLNSNTGGVANINNLNDSEESEAFAEVVLNEKEEEDSFLQLKQERVLLLDKEINSYTDQSIDERESTIVTNDFLLSESELLKSKPVLFPAGVMETPIVSVTSEILKNDARKKGWYASVFVSPTHNGIHVAKIPNGMPRRHSRDLLNKREGGKFTLDYGGLIGYMLNENWSLETGLSLKKRTFDVEHKAEVYHRGANERMNSNGDFENEYQADLNTSFGGIEADIAVTREADMPLVENSTIDLDLVTRHEMELLTIPLLVVYRNKLSEDFNFLAKGGLSTSFLEKESPELVSANSNKEGVSLRNTLLKDKPSTVKKNLASVQFGLGLEYELSDRITVSVEPTISKSIKPVFSFRDLKAYPVVASVNVGANYYF